jgi:hypothetical protein
LPNSHSINTMTRCLRLALALALCAVALPAAAQTQRNFPPTALRGEVVVGNPPEVVLNGKPARFAPGARIRGQNNFLTLSGSLAGAKLIVNFTLDGDGQLRDVWILRAEEVAVKPWPSTPEEALAWSFDAGAQTWTKP